MFLIGVTLLISSSISLSRLTFLLEDVKTEICDDECPVVLGEESLLLHDA